MSWSAIIAWLFGAVIGAAGAGYLAARSEWFLAALFVVMAGGNLYLAYDEARR